MKENDNKSPSVKITEGTIKDNLDRIKQDHPDNKTDKLKTIDYVTHGNCIYRLSLPHLQTISSQ